MPVSFYPFEIAGHGGGGKGGGGKGGTEAANSLKSRQIAKLVDILSEGPIRGVVGGARGVYLNGVVLMNADGSLNFPGAILQLVNGYPGQPIMSGFGSQMQETQVSQQLMAGVPLVRSIVNKDTDRARVTVSVPTLQSADDKGNISGASVVFALAVQNNGGGFQSYGNFEISGKTTSKYQRAISFMLPAGGPWDIRVTRLTGDSTSTKVQNDLYWDSYTALIDDRINYNLSACAGLIMDSKQFQSIPKRAYLTDGMLVQIPTNYNPDNATYNGVWNGTFYTNWTNNPAWVLYDLITNSRYGIGEFIKPSQVDKWSLYKVAQWCDQRIDNGRGGSERRFTCNCQINEQSEAFDLLNNIAAIFRGQMYWGGNQLVATADMPQDPLDEFTNANVVDGFFEYHGTDIRAHHTVAQVGWYDPAMLGTPRLAVSENLEGISRFGFQKVDVGAFATNRESEALRAGRWILYTEQYEGETVNFKTGLRGAYMSPGAIFQVADTNIAGDRMGGRVAEGTTLDRVYFDSPILSVPPLGSRSTISVSTEDGSLQTVDCLLGGGGYYADMAKPLASLPPLDSAFVVNFVGTIEPTLWRSLGNKQLSGEDRDTYEIQGTRHFPQKWDVVEKNLAFSDPSISGIVTIPPIPTDLRVKEYLEQNSPTTLSVHATVSWVGTAPLYQLAYKKEPNGNWTYPVPTDQTAIDLQLSEGTWTFWVTAISPIGIRGPTAKLTQEIIGRSEPPLEPKNFRINIVDGVALFEWLPSDDIDVKIGGRFELRHTSDTGTGAQWSSSQPIIPSIPGTASSVETSYRTGSWLLRTFDGLNQPSAKWATIIAEQADERFTEYARICESPDWLGSHQNTEIRLPEQWLQLGLTGGLWDEQLENMDTWPNVDVLYDAESEPGDNNQATHGEYTFFNRIDAGGVFPVRFSTDILAFAFSEPDTFLDSRIEDSDTWDDWDDVQDYLDGRVSLQIRHTDDDPDDPEAVWTEWQAFTGGSYTARAFEFKAILDASPGQNIGVETMCIIADLREKIDHGDDVVYGGEDTPVDFNIKFYLVPAVVITIQDAQPGDNAEIVGKDRETFTVRITNQGAQVTRTFDWHAMGY